MAGFQHESPELTGELNELETYVQEALAFGREQAKDLYVLFATIMPEVKDKLARFHETGEDQLLTVTDVSSGLSPMDAKLLDKIYKEAGCELVDFTTSEEQEVPQMPLSKDIQQNLGFVEPYIAGRVCDGPMKRGGALYRIDYQGTEHDEDGTERQVRKVVLLTSNYELPPQ